MLINCEFSNPTFLGEDPDPSKDTWNYENMTCHTEVTSTIESQIISDGDNEFNLYPSFNYGQIIIIFFLIFFLFMKIFESVWHFVHQFIIRQKWLR